MLVIVKSDLFLQVVCYCFIQGGKQDICDKISDWPQGSEWDFTAASYHAGSDQSWVRAIHQSRYQWAATDPNSNDRRTH